MKNKIISAVAALLFLAGIAAGCAVGGNPSVTTDDNKNSAGTTDTEPTQTTSGGKKDPVEYHYKNASLQENGKRLAFGVLNDINLFEPDTEVRYYISFSGKKLTGKVATVTIESVQLAYDIVKNHKLEGTEIVDSFVPKMNGIYRLRLKIVGDDTELKFSIGVVPRNKTANPEFIFSCQPCLARVFTGRYSVLGQSSVDRQAASMIKTIEYMGFNGIREDAIYWGDFQPTMDSEMNFGLFDRLLETANSHGQSLIYIIGTPPEWAYKEKYKNDTEICYNVCPEKEYWEDFCREVAVHTRNVERGKLIWQIWNEPDGEFFHGTSEEYCELLDIGARTIRQYDPDAYIIGPGLVAPINQERAEWWSKDTFPMGNTIKKLLDDKILDAYAHHLHYPFDDNFFEYMENGIGLVQRTCGLGTTGLFNTESGVCSSDNAWCATENVAKALYFRARGYKDFTVFAFSSSTEEFDGWTMFNGFLQPRESVIAYSTMLRFVGQATEHETICSDRSLFADIYYDGEKSVVTVYYDGEQKTGKGTLVLPEGKDYTAYNIYGNKKALASNEITASADCVYIVYDGKVSASDFSFRTGK